VLAATEDDVGNGLSPLSAAAAGTSDARNVSIEEKVVESNLLGPQLLTILVFLRPRPV
jgi:hypothetical protein